jgi:hypothetical protein
MSWVQIPLFAFKLNLFNTLNEYLNINNQRTFVKRNIIKPKSIAYNSSSHKRVLKNLNRF